MKRRTLFGAVIGGLVGLLVPSRSAAATDHTQAARDRLGNAICRVYRQDAEGVWREIDRRAIRPADRLVMIGQDGDRLWKCETATVLEPAPNCCPSGGFIVDTSKSEISLLN